MGLIYNYVVIEGNIGAGKTSLAIELSKRFGCRLILERFEENSFLPKFYADPSRYAFPLEMSFLADRYQQLKEELFRSDLFQTGIIADYMVDKSLIFARKTLSIDEYALYKKLFDIVHSFLPKPDLLVYLHSGPANLLAHIRKRGRSYEQTIDEEYLSKIQGSYLDFIRSKPDSRILIIECESLDFVGNADHLEWIIDTINQQYPLKSNIAIPDGAERNGRLFNP